jgi:methionyl-tRNA formyltransferase
MNVVFLGTPAFAVPTLESLLSASDIEVLCVLSQPDRPSGRGQKLLPTPVKTVAQAAGLPVFQPEKLGKDLELQAHLSSLAPDFFITVAFGQILTQAVLNIPKYGTVNVHASLLPQLRGANPIQWAILNGFAETGVTTMLTERGVDTGAMLLKATTPIGPEETADALAERLSQLGGPLLLETLRQFHTLTPTPQDHDAATHAPKLTKEAAWLDWTHPADALHRKIRGQQPWPGAQTLWQDQPLKILAASVLPTAADPGHVWLEGKQVCVGTGQGSLELRTLQPPGKRPLPALDWWRGLRVERTQFSAPAELLC